MCKSRASTTTVDFLEGGLALLMGGVLLLQVKTNELVCKSRG